mgnify:CR=1 FL=1
MGFFKSIIFITALNLIALKKPNFKAVGDTSPLYKCEEVIRKEASDMASKKLLKEAIDKYQIVGGFRQLLMYRGSINKFTVAETVDHEIFHDRKERSCMLMYRNAATFLKYRKGGLRHMTIGLLYRKEDLVQAFPGKGDVWTVRVQKDPLRVKRTRGSSSQYYDEGIVAGKAYALVIICPEGQKVPNSTLKECRYLAQKHQLKFIVK